MSTSIRPDTLQHRDARRTQTSQACSPAVISSTAPTGRRSPQPAAAAAQPSTSSDTWPPPTRQSDEDLPKPHLLTMSGRDGPGGHLRAPDLVYLDDAQCLI